MNIKTLNQNMPNISVVQLHYINYECISAALFANFV